MSETPDDITALLHALFDEFPRHLMDSLGGREVVEFDPETGRVVLEFTARPEFCHSEGVVQGGYLTGWIDAAMAHAVVIRTRGENSTASLDIRVSFLRPARPGKIRAEAWILHLGRRTVFMEGHALNNDGELLAKASSTAVLVPWPGPHRLPRA